MRRTLCYGTNDGSSINFSDDRRKPNLVPGSFFFSVPGKALETRWLYIIRLRATSRYLKLRRFWACGSMNHATASRLALSFQIAYLYRWKRIATFNNLYWENYRQYYVTWKHFQAKNETYFIVARKTCVSENFGPVSKSWKPFWWVSKSRFRVIFASRICLLFFLYGLKESNFSEFMGAACRTELVDY